MALKTFSILFGVLAVSVPAFAQDVPAAQVAGGYSYLTRPNAVLVGAIQDELPHSSSNQGGSASGSGWFAEVIGNITQYVGIVGQVSATYTSGTLNSRAWRGDDTAYAVLGGGRASLRNPNVVPFAQVLFGWVRTEADVTEQASRPVANFSDNYYALAVGGGADIRLGGAVGVHLAADVMRTSRDSDRTWRVQAGLIVPMR
jgi:hypothetical protein